MKRTMSCVAAALALGLTSAVSVLDVLADGGAEHQVLRAEFGTSGSSIEFLEINGDAYCYTGTLGGLVEDTFNPTVRYALSNNHVLARENAASIGEAIIQPGLLDQSKCALGADYGADVVAHLSNFVPLNLKSVPVGKPNNTVDAAIAELVPGTMSETGEILDIGLLDPVPATAAIGMPVTKSGRTTGQTHGMVSAVDVSIAVQYSNGFGLFKKQIRISGLNGQAFIRPGDSGALLLTDTTEPPQALGLLFAGGEFDAFANPIDAVLGALGVAMAGCSESPACLSVASDGGKGGGKRGQKGGGKPKARSLAPGLTIASAVKARHEDSLFRNPAVVGTGISLNESGDAIIEIYTKHGLRRAKRKLPRRLDGIPVRIIETGLIYAR